MPIKTPSFWYRKQGKKAPPLEKILKPASAIYKYCNKVNQRRQKVLEVDAPVICVGNVTAGGSGKTPTAIALMNLIKSENIAQNPFFLTRGYGGNHSKPTLLDEKLHTYEMLGDEAFLLAKHAPVIVSKNRVAGAKLAVEHGADMIIMDDGFQNQSLHKDLSIMVVDGKMGFGNDQLLPAGPLREPLEDAFSKTDLFVLIGKDERDLSSTLKATGKPIVEANIQRDPATILPDKDVPLLAFTGLGYPQKFFEYLKNDLNLNIVKTTSFPDHYKYKNSDIISLNEKAKSLNAHLITTSKDMIRIPEIQRDSIYEIKINLDLGNLSSLIKSLRKQTL